MQAAAVDSFIAELGDGLNLFTGPLNWQDGSVYLADGEEATEVQIWYSGPIARRYARSKCRRR